MFPRAARVPGPLNAPPVSVVVPVIVRVVPAATVFVPAACVRLLNVSAVVTVSVAAPPPKDTVPLPGLNVPPVSEKFPDTEWVADVEAKLPPLIAKGPFTVNAAVPPVNVPPAWLQPVAPTVAVIPAAWVIVPP